MRSNIESHPHLNIFIQYSRQSPLNPPDLPFRGVHTQLNKFNNQTEFCQNMLLETNLNPSEPWRSKSFYVQSIPSWITMVRKLNDPESNQGWKDQTVWGFFTFMNSGKGKRQLTDSEVLNQLFWMVGEKFEVITIYFRN